MILSHWLSFRASCTLIRPTFVWTRELVVISTPCIHSCRQPLSYVCLNRMYVWYSKFVWLARLSASFRSWIFRSCDQFSSRIIVRQFCASVSRMQPVWKLLNWLFEQIRICLTQRRIIVLLRLYLSLYWLCCLGVFLTLNSYTPICAFITTCIEVSSNVTICIIKLVCEAVYTPKHALKLFT